MPYLIQFPVSEPGLPDATGAIYDDESKSIQQVLSRLQVEDELIGGDVLTIWTVAGPPRSYRIETTIRFEPINALGLAADQTEV